MMEKLADAILKHSKLIIAIWVVLLLVAGAIIVTCNPNSVLKYEITNMEGASSESDAGNKILKDNQYFESQSSDYVVVFTYNPENPTEKSNLKEKFIPALEDKVKDHWKEQSEKTQTETKTSSVELGNNLIILSITLPKDTTDKNAGVDWLRNTISELKKDTNLGYNNTTYVTGTVALGYDTQVAAVADVMKIDPFSILLVLVLIGLFFRSLISAATPPITIGVAYAVVLMSVYFIGQAFDIFYITTILVLISMLGAGCDYCIFIIARYREERKLGKDKDTSLKEAIMWAGESVAISGLCVIIGFGVMSLCSFSLVKTMGIILALGIIFALIAALTLIPSIVHLVGDKIFWPTKVEDYQEGSKVCNGWYGKIGKFGQRYFRSSAKLSIKHAGVILVAAIILTVPLTYVALTEKTSFDMVSTMPDSESKQGIELITNSGAGGMTMPTYVLLDLDMTDGEKPFAVIDDTSMIPTLTWTNPELAAKLTTGTWYYPGLVDTDRITGLSKMIIEKDQANDTPEEKKGNISAMMGIVSWKALVNAFQEEGQSFYDAETYVINKIAETLKSEELRDSLIELRNVIAPLGEDFRCSVFDYILNVTALSSISKASDGHQYAKMTVLFKDQAMSDKSMDTAVLVRNAANEYEDTDEGKVILVKDGYKTYTTGTTAILYDISEQVQNDFRIIEIVVILLIIVLLMLVMRSYFTPIRSVLTIIMSIMWTLGLTHLLFGHVLGQPIIWLVPIVLFVICLGLGMDYDVLLTTRIKEYVGKGMDNDTAIAQAVEHSGVIITLCGLIMGGAFMSMVLSSTPMLQQFGFALGFAILVDALVIRTYVVPAVMHLLGKWNWIGPKFRYREQIEKEHEMQKQQQ